MDFLLSSKTTFYVLLLEAINTSAFPSGDCHIQVRHEPELTGATEEIATLRKLTTAWLDY